jgi:hypothetical protein
LSESGRSTSIAYLEGLEESMCLKSLAMLKNKTETWIVKGEKIK